MKNIRTRIAFAALALVAAGLTACNNNKTDSSNAKMEAKSAPINKMCAINPHDEADAKITSTCDGKTVGFCCAKCKGKFDKMTHEQQEAVVAKAQ